MLSTANTPPLTDPIPSNIAATAANTRRRLIVLIPGAKLPTCSATPGWTLIQPILRQAQYRFSRVKLRKSPEGTPGQVCVNTLHPTGTSRARCPHNLN